MLGQLSWFALVKNGRRPLRILAAGASSEEIAAWVRGHRPDAPISRLARRHTFLTFQKVHLVT
jgi:hypothetical protein